MTKQISENLSETIIELMMHGVGITFYGFNLPPQLPEIRIELTNVNRRFRATCELPDFWKLTEKDRANEIVWNIKSLIRKYPELI